MRGWSAGVLLPLPLRLVVHAGMAAPTAAGTAGGASSGPYDAPVDDALLTALRDVHRDRVTVLRMEEEVMRFMRQPR